MTHVHSFVLQQGSACRCGEIHKASIDHAEHIRRRGQYASCSECDATIAATPPSLAAEAIQLGGDWYIPVDEPGRWYISRKP